MIKAAKPSRQKESNHEKLYLFGVLLLATILGLYHINTQSVWTDESISVHSGLQAVKDIFLEVEPTPPLHSILLHFWMQFFGISAIAIRSLSLLFSVACVYMIYLVGNLINKKIGIYAALLLAINPISIVYAQEARAYSLLFLMTLCSMYFYIKYMKSKSWLDIAFYTLSTVLMIYTQVFGVFVILVQTIHYIFQDTVRDNGFGKKAWKNMLVWISIQAIILILYMPWLLILPRIISSNHNALSQNATPIAFSIITDLFAQLSLGIVFPLFGIIIIILSFIMILLFLFSKEKKSLVLLWLIIPVLVPLIISIYWIPIYSIRHASLIVIPFILVISLGLNTLSKKAKNLVLLTIVILTLGCVIIQQNTDTKDDWKNINQYIKSQNATQIGIMSWYEALPLSYYYYPDCMINEKSHKEIYSCLRSKGVIAIEIHDNLDWINKDRVLLITSRLENTPQSEMYIDLMKDRYDFKEDVIFYAYNKTIFSGKFFNIIDPSNPQFNKVVIYTLEKKTGS